jgi:hypothetical protein
LLDVPDANYTGALTTLFDNAEDPVLPAEELLTTLAAPPTGGWRPARRRRNAAHDRRTDRRCFRRAPDGAAAAVATAAARRTRRAPLRHTTDGHRRPHRDRTRDRHCDPSDRHRNRDPSRRTHGAATPNSTGARTRPWAADSAHSATALAGDIAHAELGFFGSLLGFDSAFERDLHSQVGTHPPPALVRPAPQGPHRRRSPRRAAHPDAAHPAATGAAAAHTGAAAHPGAAHQTVEQIVDDPYALDELATRLYPTIRSRLRQELLIDRERAGLLADFR